MVPAKERAAGQLRIVDSIVASRIRINIDRPVPNGRERARVRRRVKLEKRSETKNGMMKSRNEPQEQDRNRGVGRTPYPARSGVAHVQLESMRAPLMEQGVTRTLPACPKLVRPINAASKYLLRSLPLASSQREDALKVPGLRKQIEGLGGRQVVASGEEFAKIAHLRGRIA